MSSKLDLFGDEDDDVANFGAAHSQLDMHRILDTQHSQKRQQGVGHSEQVLSFKLPRGGEPFALKSSSSKSMTSPSNSLSSSTSTLSPLSAASLLSSSSAAESLSPAAYSSKKMGWGHLETSGGSGGSAIGGLAGCFPASSTLSASASVSSGAGSGSEFSIFNKSSAFGEQSLMVNPDLFGLETALMGDGRQQKEMHASISLGSKYLSDAAPPISKLASLPLEKKSLGSLSSSPVTTNKVSSQFFTTSSASSSASWLSLTSPVAAAKTSALSIEQEADEEIFGLGTFGDLFITEEDLKRAREKLAEEEAKDPIQIFAETLEKIIRIFGYQSDEMEVGRDLSSFKVVDGISVFVNYMAIGIGSFYMHDQSPELVWSGHLISEDTFKVNLQVATSQRTQQKDIAQINQLNPAAFYAPSNKGDHKNASLRFKYEEMTDVRLKHLPSELPLLLSTIREEYYLQFKFPNENEANQVYSNIKSRQLLLRKQMVSTIDSNSNVDISPDEAGPNISTVVKDNAEYGDDWSEDSQLHELRTSLVDAEALMNLKINQAKEEFLSLKANIEEKMKQVSSLAQQRRLRQQPVKASENSLCGICISNQEERVIMPCGHRICSDCAERLRQEYSVCPWDRQTFNSIDIL